MSAIFGPFEGIRNTVKARQIGPQDLAAGVNIDLNDAKRSRRRGGKALLSAGAATSLFAHGELALFQRSGALRSLEPDGSSTQIVSGVGDRIAYGGVGERVYWSDGVVTGVIEGGVNQSWGMAPPGLPAYAEHVSGELGRGHYLYTMTVMRDGLESGAGPSIATDEIQGGIAFSSIPVVSADEKRIYLTHPNGRELYLALRLAPGATSATFTADATALSVRLETQFMQPPPPASIIKEHNGRLLLAIDRFLLWTPPYRHDLCDPVRMSYAFSAPLRIVAPVEGGVFVGTDDEIVYLSGEDIASATRVEKAGYGAVAGTLDYTEGHHVGEGMTGRVALFTSHRGVCVAGSGGQFQNLTLDRYVMPRALSGAGAVRLEDGWNRYIAVLRDID